MKYGISVTDSCISLETTEDVLQNLYRLIKFTFARFLENRL